MSNFIEQELRKLFADDSMIESPQKLPERTAKLKRGNER